MARVPLAGVRTGAAATLRPQEAQHEVTPHFLRVQRCPQGVSLLSSAGPLTELAEPLRPWHGQGEG